MQNLTKIKYLTIGGLLFALVVGALLPVVDLIERDDLAGREQLLAVAGLVFVIGAAVKPSLEGLAGFDDMYRPGPAIVAAVPVGLALMIWLGPEANIGPQLWAIPFAVAVSGVMIHVGRGLRRWVGAAGLVAGVAVSVATGDGADIFTTAVWILAAQVTIVSQVWLWDITLQLDAARESAGEVAVLEERVRFAGDLHDVQGHQLQAIAIKAELAGRLVGRDDDAARAQTAELRELAMTALADTRKLVHDLRRVPLDTELDNAVAVLGSAGIETEVRRSGEAALDEQSQALFGALVREGATNVLRHTEAEHCRIELEAQGSRVTVRMVDDGRGASTGGGDDGTGIDGLRERFAKAGGRVEAGPSEGGGFELRGEVGG